MWETLPRGRVGLQTVDSRLQLGEEPHVLQVSQATSQQTHRWCVTDLGRTCCKVCNLGRDGGGCGGAEPRVWCVWRTECGRLANAYSSDGGATFEAMSWMTFDGGAGGRPLRNPRGAITPYRFKRDGPDGHGRFAFLYYNNGHTERDG